MLADDTLNCPAFVLAREQLLYRHDLDERAVERILSDISTSSVDFADLYFQRTMREAWRMEEGMLKSASSDIAEGLGVRAVCGDQTTFSFTEDWSSAGIARAISFIRPMTNFASPCEAPVPRLTARSARSARYASSDPLFSLDAGDKVALLQRIDQRARGADPRVKAVISDVIGEYDVALIARSDGLLAADVRPLVRLNIKVIVEQDGRRESGISGGGGRFDFAHFTDEVLAKYVDEAVQSALVNLDARPAPAGAMTVVLGAGWPGILLHEAIGHGLEGDFNRKGSSAFTGRIGERVASKGVNIVDDGTLPGRRGSLNMDDEGNPAQCTTLIEDGILTGYLQDTLNARLMNVPVTGNGRRQSYKSLPMPRMTNTYMRDGDADPREIIESVQNGLYAVNFSGGQVDITNGAFVFTASQAYMIENGRITYPVKGATLTGSGPEVLKYVSMIGNDMKLDDGVGTCGKEGQTVPVGVGQPTLRIDNLTVGGTARR